MISRLFMARGLCLQPSRYAVSRSMLSLPLAARRHYASSTTTSSPKSQSDPEAASTTTASSPKSESNPEAASTTTASSPKSQSNPKAASTTTTSSPKSQSDPEADDLDSDHFPRFPGSLTSLKSEPNFDKYWAASVKNSESWEDFVHRHIGPRDADIESMLNTVGADSLDTLVTHVIPKDVLLPPQKSSTFKFKVDENTIGVDFNRIISRNVRQHWMNGGGYYPVDVPPVIKRNLLENPAWYTSYTPYQAELSQGRLESLLNFQTMVSDLTGLPVANASLLDEGSAAAEAMTMSLNSLPAARAKRPNKTYVVSHLVHYSTVRVMRGRAGGFGITIQVLNLSKPETLDEVKALGDDLVGVMVQYPDSHGDVCNFRSLADIVHAQGALFSAATDLSCLTLLTPPGEWGADIAFGNSQRWGVPLGFGGPHAAFIATKESLKRRLPGRIVGVSKDRTGRPALRLALQTREQHIRREKATSNVCTAQALLANMSAMYAVYHGPHRLREMAITNLRHARMIQSIAQHYGLNVITSSVDPTGRVLSDTVSIHSLNSRARSRLRKKLGSQYISVGRSRTDDNMTFAVSNKFSIKHFAVIAQAFQDVSQANNNEDFAKVAMQYWSEAYSLSSQDIINGLPAEVRRESKFLTHPVFNSHHSETEMLRYMHHLQSKDLSLVHSMIPLGSCTMKLNGTSQMELIGHNSVSSMHPLAPSKFAMGFEKLFNLFSKQLAILTGMDDTSLQPNSGAQGEFAGLRAIAKYHENHSQGNAKRDICLIPTSAHGTNPASAAMAGMRVVPVKCDGATGNLDIEDLKAKAQLHEKELAAIMITYPSTYGVFEPEIRNACQIVHEHGGLVYMDGANMNAQIGLTSPGALGADVCHLNLHKTFCIPHGGGGPGVGPICVKESLKAYMPHLPGQNPVCSASYGSASIVPISWGYMQLMGDAGLRKATCVALLNANYLLTRLKDDYSILYTNDKGRCAHEFILDVRGFSKTADIEAIDIAKRLQDYGFHAPTMSWPVANTLMIEPTESESKAELDRFVDALISIRQEIREVEEGKQPRQGNVLKNAPHSQIDIVLGDDGKWERPYSREQAAYPLPYLKEKKFWPSVSRVDDTYGDTNLFCTCPPVEDTTGAN